jgi:hypothetical protein
MRDLAEDADEARSERKVKFRRTGALELTAAGHGLACMGSSRAGTCSPRRAPFECARVGTAAVPVFAAA